MKHAAELAIGTFVRERAYELHPGPVGRRATAFPAAAPKHHRTVASGFGGDLGSETGLSDPRLAEEEADPAASGLSRGKRGAQSSELLGATYKGAAAGVERRGGVIPWEHVPLIIDLLEAQQTTSRRAPVVATSTNRGRVRLRSRAMSRCHQKPSNGV
jgi:hypothetical protein